MKINGSPNCILYSAPLYPAEPVAGSYIVTMGCTDLIT